VYPKTENKPTSEVGFTWGNASSPMGQLRGEEARQNRRRGLMDGSYLRVGIWRIPEAECWALSLDVWQQVHSSNGLSKSMIDDLAKRRERNSSTNEIDEKSAALQFLENETK
jgi:hypothetical protein